MTMKIYLKDSDKARLANVRIRIIRELDSREPCDNEDLVFEKAEGEEFIPENALYKWKFDYNGEHEPDWFFTTAKRCKEMVSENPEDWTLEKLEAFAKSEKKLYQDWFDGSVYGFVVERWNDKKRDWDVEDSLWGMYGADALLDNLVDHLEGGDIPEGIVCLDDEDMKYDFDNTEKRVNEFA